ncbi:MAG: aminoacyl-tRNA hydrolase [Spirochaetales bacterium]
MQDAPQLLAILGNAGVEYKNTRHNVGWMLVEQPPFDAACTWQKKFKAEWATCSIGGSRVTVLLPQTMVNRSGESVQAAAHFFKLEADQIAVAHDDVELAFGEIGIRLGGGLAGHNGLRSVANSLGTNAYWRIRIGVGRPAHGALRNHVLGRFTKEEESELPDILRRVVTLLERGYREGFGKLPPKVDYRSIV